MTSKNRTIPVSLVFVFIAAVLVPSIALSFLALRAADRESLYMERRLESTLLTEVNLAAREVERLMNRILLQLENDENTSLVDVPFILQDGTLTLLGGSDVTREAFAASFGAFLRGSARLPMYDNIAQVYRKEMQTPSYSADSARSASSGGSPFFTSSFYDSQHEGEEVFSLASSILLPTPSASPAPSQQKEAPRGIDRQLMKSQISANADLREEAFNKASQEGFEIVQRNVMPQAQQFLADVVQDERSRTVSQSRTFAELRREADSGLLPRLSDLGLEVLFWRALPDVSGEKIVGCTLRMSAVRERIADVLPDVLSEVRVLTVLDDRGSPLLVPELAAVPDWRRPFVAVEISPLLPRWEVASWLKDPAALTSRAQFAALAVWVLVAVLVCVIALGGAFVLWMLSSEIRVARQKTTFVANVSHELKTPLTSIRLFAELLLSEKQRDEAKRREYLRTMVSETDRLSHLVDNVLSFSKRGKENSPMQVLALTELTDETVKQLEPHFTKNGFKINMEKGNDPLYVYGNKEALRQVMMNLLSNAEKYSDEIREISVSCRSERGFAVIKVSDRGIGVEPRFAAKIFQEFFRGDDSLSALRSGTGLGLSIARTIARRHGGDVLYAPHPEGGSIFSLCLPLRNDPM